jgi:hypothetical protein
MAHDLKSLICCGYGLLAEELSAALRSSPSASMKISSSFRIDKSLEKNDD